MIFYLLIRFIYLLTYSLKKLSQLYFWYILKTKIDILTIYSKFLRKTKFWAFIIFDFPIFIIYNNNKNLSFIANIFIFINFKLILIFF